ncbi:MAG: molybdopterin-dependent oxidoreductase [Rhodospirillaceae bacterium]
MHKIHGSHWGAFEAEASGGRITSVRALGCDPDPSPILTGMAEAVHHDCRVKRPAVREGWLKRRDRARGAGRFVELPWDEALDIVAEEIRRVKDAHGNEAIFAGSYGWSSAGRFHHAKTQMQRFMNCIGGFTGQKHSYSIAAGLAILPHIVGDLRPLRGLTSWSAIAANTDLIIAFGGIGTKNTQVEPGGTAAHTTQTWFEKLAERGIKVVSVTPLRHDTADCLNAEWLAPRPNTDVALMLGLAHTLVAEGLHDPEFLETYTVGADRFIAYVMGDADGTAKSADWAAAICGIPAETIRTLARRMAQGRTMIMTSYSLQRGDHGEQPFWMTMALGCILGQVGLPGGGFGFGYGSMHGQGNPAPKMPTVSHTAGGNPTGSFIPVARVTDLLLNPGAEYDFDGERRTYPDIKLIYWCGGNPFHHHQDLNRLLDGWRRPDTVIVNEPWWTPTAKLADIVLPATTTLERNDLGASSRDRFIVAMKQIVPPQGYARNDFDIFTGLAERMGVENAFTEGRDEAAWLRFIYDQARENAGPLGNRMPEFDQFWDDGLVELDPPEKPFNVYEEFRADPKANPLATPSGRFEICCDTIERFGYDDCRAHPVWLEPAEWLGADLARDYPLHLISNQPKTKLHSQMDFAGISREAKIGGREPAFLNPADAAARGIVDGDIIRIFNGRGETLAALQITDGVMPGVVQLPTGAWFDPADWAADRSLERHGNPNVLTLDKGTSKLAQGPISHTTLVEVEKFTGAKNDAVQPEPFRVPETIPTQAAE